MQTLTQTGSFTQSTRDAINQNFQTLAADFYVDATNGYDGNPGTSPGLAFRTMTPMSTLLPRWRDGSYSNPNSLGVNQPITISLCGVLSQEWSSPIVSDVAIVGAGNVPRQATTSGTANGGGATWLSPTVAAASLLKINGQAWRVENIYFNNSCTTATTACIELVGGGDPPLTADAGHTTIRGCVLTGEANGIYINGGPGFLVIENNKIFYFDSSGDCGILAGGSGGTGWGSVIRNNNFTANLTHIKGLSAAYGWHVYGNRFSYIDVGVTAVSQINFTGGSNNSVHNNYFDLPYSTNGISAMFVLGTNDRWYFNEFATAVTTTIYSFGAPVS